MSQAAAWDNIAMVNWSNGTDISLKLAAPSLAFASWRISILNRLNTEVNSLYVFSFSC